MSANTPAEQDRASAPLTSTLTFNGTDDAEIVCVYPPDCDSPASVVVSLPTDSDDRALAAAYALKIAFDQVPGDDL